jgi:hypothetical protein
MQKPCANSQQLHMQAPAFQVCSLGTLFDHKEQRAMEIVSSSKTTTLGGVMASLQNNSVDVGEFAR